MASLKRPIYSYTLPNFTLSLTYDIRQKVDGIDSLEVANSICFFK